MNYGILYIKKKKVPLLPTFAFLFYFDVKQTCRRFDRFDLAFFNCLYKYNYIKILYKIIFRDRIEFQLSSSKWN